MNNFNNEKSMDNVDKRVAMITGEPKKAIRTLSLPMITSMFLILQSSYVLEDLVHIPLQRWGLSPPYL